MKQIKTIIETVSNGYYDRDAEKFDTAVNKAIENGWTLTERKIVHPISQPDGSTSLPMLYAELERHIITEDEKNCNNCAHCNLPPDREPCLSCSDDGDKWEAEA